MIDLFTRWRDHRIPHSAGLTCWCRPVVIGIMLPNPEPGEDYHYSMTVIHQGDDIPAEEIHMIFREAMQP